MTVVRITTLCVIACLGAVTVRASSLAGTSGEGFREANTMKPQPGDPFPVLMLPSLEDETPTSIAQFRGRKVLLHQFASW